MQTISTMEMPLVKAELVDLIVAKKAQEQVVDLLKLIHLKRSEEQILLYIFTRTFVD